MKHELKTWPEYFREVVAGNKRFEVRNNDRDYQVGDTLVLLEWEPETKEYTGADYICKVGYVLDNPAFVKDGTVVMSIESLNGFFEEGDNT